MTLINTIEKVRLAQKEYSKFTQEQVDEIFREASLAANNARIKLAKMAVEETGMGIVEDKVIKNHFASEYIYNSYKDTKTCGTIEVDAAYGVEKIAEPIGVIAGIVPTTNPTSTAIFKALLALKTRNGIIFSPHPRAKNATIEAAKIVLEAAVKAGAPKDIIGWIAEPSVQASNDLMKMADLILATGGPGMVKAAYSSGTPAIGVGAGNTPVIIDETAHIKMAVNSILLSKTFDNGVICASEQAVIIPTSIYDKVKEEFTARNAYILKGDEVDKVRKTIVIDGHLNGDIVGQSAYKIAQMAGVTVPENTKVIIGEVESVELEEAFSHEKLSPVLAMYKAKNFEDALKKADRLIELGGMGHTSVLYADELVAKDKIDLFGKTMKTGRTLINMPAAQGAIGDVFNFKLAPSLTLGCGSWGGNAVSENVGVKHLINIKTVAKRRENMLWFRIPERVYFKFGSLPVALEELKGKKKAVIVTDQQLASLGYTDHITTVLENIGVDFRVFSDVQADPTLSVVEKGAELMRNYNPDVIIALGGGSAMDAAKIMWVMYEHPKVNFKDLAMTFMDIRKRIVKFPKMGEKAEFWAVATSAGTGSEVTPFAVITDDTTGVKYPLADYEITPNVAVVDPQLMLSMPAGLTAASGIDVVTHAIEAYVSIMASEFTNPLALEATRLTFKYLPESVKGGALAVKAKEKMANASCMAGMAFSNAFLGICHSMAHKLGAAFHLPHGVANALLLDEVIRFNATDRPFKMAGFAQYKYPHAKECYAKLADYLGFTKGNETPEEKAKILRKKISELKTEIGIKSTIAEYGISEQEFLSKLDQMVEDAFDDQCTGANPRYPLMSDLKEMYLRAYYGPEKYLAMQKKSEEKSEKKAK
ncbi:MAG: bifunctional acetaldehyde-CoA/alcohol dehydrogenase [Cetobacterium sp.]|uniref:bifunctional acetaldehyde-CoA/alcohol dehydrogenase n=2 Tax=Fusobacteriaceae TaxID=203492 RepID=UPI001F05FCE9|nr:MULTISPECIES: bifunctional acetaldehyde-CoA/alcohol dehydrogenase [Cetobacterium]MCX3067573.1 bifunctional acetaldehyde-CoA/alcohol dehydrogenase [Cetobacterium somerae]UPO96907.1 bifunctional acetaldehyde-CoA/alcohol dehydrogenase [Cetobacterium somerae]